MTESNDWLVGLKGNLHHNILQRILCKKIRRKDVYRYILLIVGICLTFQRNPIGTFLYLQPAYCLLNPLRLVIWHVKNNQY